MAPAAAKQGRAVVSGLGITRSGCDAAYVVEGVAFRLVPVSLTESVLEGAHEPEVRRVEAAEPLVEPSTERLEQTELVQPAVALR